MSLLFQDISSLGQLARRLKRGLTPNTQTRQRHRPLVSMKHLILIFSEASKRGLAVHCIASNALQPRSAKRQKAGWALGLLAMQGGGGPRAPCKASGTRLTTSHRCPWGGPAPPLRRSVGRVRLLRYLKLTEACQTKARSKKSTGMIGNTSTIGSKGAYASGNFASKKAINYKSILYEV